MRRFLRKELHRNLLERTNDARWLERAEVFGVRPGLPVIDKHLWYRKLRDIFPGRGSYVYIYIQRYIERH